MADGGSMAVDSGRGGVESSTNNIGLDSLLASAQDAEVKGAAAAATEPATQWEHEDASAMLI